MLRFAHKFYLVTALFLLSYSSGFAQDWLWALQITGSENIETEAIKTDFNNNIIVLTEITGNVTIGAQSFSSQNNEKDMLLIKLNKFGTILWTVQIGNTNIEDPKSVYIDANNNVYLTGSFGGNLTFGDVTITSTDVKDAFLAKIDSNGNIVWAKNMGQNAGIQKGRSITSDGNYLYVLGFYKESVLLSRANDTLLQGTANKNYFLVKYDFDGNLINAHRIYSSSNGVLFSDMLYLNNDIYLSGYYTDTIIYSNDTLVSINHSRDFILMKVDLNGNLLWANSYGGTANDEIWDMASDGLDIYVTGYFKNTINVDSYTLTSNGDRDIFIGKFDQNGNTLWALSTGNTGDDRALGMAYKNNHLVVTGLFSNSLSWGNTSTAYANSEPFIGYVSADGTFINALPITVSNAGLNWGYKIIEDNNQNIFVTGKFNASNLILNSNINLPNANSGNFEGYIAKYGCFDGITMNVTDAGCSGHNDGIITATPNEGYGPFTYNWSNGETTQTISGLNQGNYYVTISNQSGCSATATAHITYHPPLSVSTQITNEILCNGDNDGEITATASDGQPAYSYNWSTGDTTPVISNLSPGDYTITASDQCGNNAIQTVTLTEPDSLDINLTGNLYHIGHSCKARVVAHGSGGTSPYTYYWYDINGNYISSGSNIWLNADNYYIIIVVDANACSKGWYFYIPGCNKSASQNNNNGNNVGTPYDYTNVDLTYSNIQVVDGMIKGSGSSGSYDKELINELKNLGFKIEPEIKVFPNPANNNLTLKVAFPTDENAQIILLNSIGQTIQTIGWSQTLTYERNVDVSNLKDGIYFILIKTESGTFKQNVVIAH